MVGRGYLNVKVWDGWCREYQVLKGRTHPKMGMESCSGFLAVGYRPAVLLPVLEKQKERKIEENEDK